MQDISQVNTKEPDISWMDDPLVRDIPRKKLDFLAELFCQSRGKTQKEFLAAFMPLLKRAKKEQLSFTPEEMKAAIAAIKLHSSEEERQKIDELVASNPFAAKKPSQ